MSKKSIKVANNGRTVQITIGATLPNVDYVIEIAKKDYGFTFPKGVIPIFLIDLYTMFAAYDQVGEENYNHGMILLKYPEIIESLKEQNISFDDREIKAYYTLAVNTLNMVNLKEARGYSPLSKALDILLVVVNAPNRDADNINKIFDYEATITDHVIDDGLQNVKNYGTKDVDLEGVSRSKSDSFEDPFKLTTTVRDFVHSGSIFMKKVILDNPYKSLPVNSAFIKTLKAKMYLTEKLNLGERSSKELEQSNDTNTRVLKTMSSYSQVRHASLSDRVSPTFQSKVLQKSLSVKTKMAPKKVKQAVSLLTDISGSMNELIKQSYVRGIYLHFCEEVVKGNMVINHRFYERNIIDESKADDLKSAQELFKKICTTVPNMGGTDIGACLQTQIDQLSSDPSTTNKEIFIILDGQDKIDPKKIKFKGVIVNAVCIGNQNAGVRETCILSGGRYESITFH